MIFLIKETHFNFCIISTFTNSNEKSLLVNHFLTLKFFDMWLCLDVGPFKTMQFEKVKCLHHYTISIL